MYYNKNNMLISKFFFKLKKTGSRFLFLIILGLFFVNALNWAMAAVGTYPKTLNTKNSGDILPVADWNDVVDMVTNYSEIFKIQSNSAPENSLYVDNSGNIGIGSTSPNFLLSVGNKFSVNANGDVIANSFSGTLNASNISGTIPASKGGTGINSYSVGDLLYASSTNSLATLSKGSNNTVLTIDNSGNYTWTATSSLSGSSSINSGTQGQIAYYASNGTTLTGTSSIFIDQYGKIGIGTTTPQATFDVLGSAKISGDLNMSGANILGISKLTAATIDPLYRIGDTNYSTYATSLAGGVKEETVGAIQISTINYQLSTLNKKPTYIYTIDFNNLEEGSDLWIFHKITDLGESWENLAVTVSAGFNGKTWYEKNPQDNQLLIYAQPTIYKRGQKLEATYRLIGNRFDHAEWPNKAKDQNETPSLIIE